MDKQFVYGVDLATKGGDYSCMCSVIFNKKTGKIENIIFTSIPPSEELINTQAKKDLV